MHDAWSAVVIENVNECDSGKTIYGKSYANRAEYNQSKSDRQKLNEKSTF